MKKKDAIPTSIKLDRIESSWEDNQAVQVLMQYGRGALFALLVAIAIIFLIYRLMTMGKEQKEMDFWNATKEFQVFAKPSALNDDPLIREDALTKLNSILSTNPELYPKYDGLVAQTLINRGDAGDALPFAKRAISRTEPENQPYYTNYTRTTMLIAESRFDEALKEALALDTQMRDAIKQNLSIAQRKFGDSLFAFNLLRIGMLQQQLGLKDQERKTWQEWKQYVATIPSTPLSKAFQQQSAILTEGKVTLSDYIDARLAK